MTVVQQIVYTENPRRWWHIAEALGLLTVGEPEPEWSEFDGDGILAIHRATGTHRPGRTDLHLLVTDLDAARAALLDLSVRVTSEDMAGIGTVVTVHLMTGLTFTLSESDRVTTGGPLVIEPILFTAEVDATARVLEAIDFRPQIRADRGGWVQLGAAGGSVGVHHGDQEAVGRSFRFNGDVEVLAASLRAADLDATVVDEAFARTVRIPDPDGGEDIWINGAADDLYGYRRVD